MLITLGRNKIDGKTSAVVEEKDGIVYINTYKQKKGWSNHKHLVESIQLTDDRVNEIVDYYNRLKIVKH